MIMEEILVNVDIMYKKKTLTVRKLYCTNITCADVQVKVQRQVVELGSRYLTLAMITDLQSAVTGHLPLGNSKYFPYL